MRDGHLELRADKRTIEQAPNYAKNQEFDLNRVCAYWGVSRAETSGGGQQQPTPINGQQRSQ